MIALLGVFLSGLIYVPITLTKYSKFLLNMVKAIDIVSKTTYTILCNHIYQKHIIAMYAVHNYS